MNAVVQENAWFLRFRNFANVAESLEPLSRPYFENCYVRINMKLLLRSVQVPASPTTHDLDELGVSRRLYTCP